MSHESTSGDGRGAAGGPTGLGRCLVTGGGGFLGKRIVELLRERGDTVRFLARGHYPEVEALGAEGMQIDLRDRAALDAAVEGVDTVFHVAAKAGAWGDFEVYRSINVDGTTNLLDAAQQAGVKRFIYTSTPSVVSYASDIENGQPDLPYAERYPAAYPETKAMAERAALAANRLPTGDDPGFLTTSLRPHLIFGPGDANLLPRFTLATLKGRMRILGDGKNLVDFTYVDNAAWAELDAADALAAGNHACAGKAYFISNGEPVPMWGWFNDLLQTMGQPPITQQMTAARARTVFGLVETVYRWLPFLGEPTVTRFLADAMTTHHWFDMAPAERDFGYRIRVSMDEAVGPTAEDLKARVVEPFERGELG